MSPGLEEDKSDGVHHMFCWNPCFTFPWYESLAPLVEKHHTRCYINDSFFGVKVNHTLESKLPLARIFVVDVILRNIRKGNILPLLFDDISD